MIPQLVTHLTGDWQPYLKSAGIHLAQPLHVLQTGGPAGAARKVVFLVFSAAARQPAVVLKVGRDAGHNGRLVEEFAILNSLWQRPALHANIPQPLGLFGLGEHLVLVEKTLPGVPLNVVLRRNRRQLNRSDGERLINRYLTAATTWLDWFQETGPTTGTNFPGWEAIAAHLARLPDNGLPPPFVAHLEQQAGRLQDLTLSLVNSHGDFWPGNLLWGGESYPCGIYDWETFHPARAPFYDLFLFITTFALECPWVGETRAERFRYGFLADTWLSRLLAGKVTALFGRYKLPMAAAPFFYAQFLLEMATPGAAAGLKRREQAGSWQALLQQYACAAPGLRPFAGKRVP